MFFLKNTKLRLYRFETAVVLTGIVLLLVGGIIENSTVVKEDSEYYAKTPQTTVTQNGCSYEEKYEKQIERVLEGMEGVDKVEVAVYVKTGGSSVPAVNSSSDTTVVSEKNGETSAEEKRNIKEESIVIIKDSQGNEKAVMLSEIAPEIEGVAVCVKGKQSKITEEKIVKTLMALYGISSAKISITW